jgi:hypothetical protein
MSPTTSTMPWYIFEVWQKKWWNFFFVILVLKGYFWHIFTKTIILKKWLFLVTNVTNHLDHALVHFRSLTKKMIKIFFRGFGLKRLFLTHFYIDHNSEKMTFSYHKCHQPPRPCLGTFSKFDKKMMKIFFRDFGLKRLFLTHFYIDHNSEKMTFSYHKCHQPPRPCLDTFSKFDKKKWWNFFFVILVLKAYFWHIFT